MELSNEFGVQCVPSRERTVTQAFVYFGSGVLWFLLVLGSGSTDLEGLQGGALEPLPWRTLAFHLSSPEGQLEGVISRNRNQVLSRQLMVHWCPPVKDRSGQSCCSQRNPSTTLSSGANSILWDLAYVVFSCADFPYYYTTNFFLIVNNISYQTTFSIPTPSASLNVASSPFPSITPLLCVPVPSPSSATFSYKLLELGIHQSLPNTQSPVLLLSPTCSTTTITPALLSVIDSVPAAG